MGILDAPSISKAQADALYATSAAVATAVGTQFDLAVPITAGNAQPVTNLGTGLSGVVTVDTFAAANFKAEITGAVVFNLVVAPVVSKPFARVLIKVRNPSAYKVSFAGNVSWIGTPVYGPHAIYEVRTFDGVTYYAQEASNLPDFNPARLTGLDVWYRSDAIPSADGTVLSQWDDLSTHGKALVQATGAQQPILRWNQINTLPTVEYDGADAMATSAFSAVSPPFSIAVVVKPDLVTSVRRIIDGGGTWHLSINAGTFRLSDTITNIDSAAASAVIGQTKIVVGVVNGASSKIRVNDVQTTGTLTTGFTTQKYTLGRNNAQSANPYDGMIGEVIISAGAAWSSTEITNVEAYLAAKWAVTLA
jgi:hypothetical protein